MRDVLTRDPAIKAHLEEPLPGYGLDEPPILAAVHRQDRDMVDALLEFGAMIIKRSR